MKEIFFWCDFLFSLFLVIYIPYVIINLMLKRPPNIASKLKVRNQVREYLWFNYNNKKFTVYDLGSGWGKIIFSVSNFFPKATFIGIERNIGNVFFSKFCKLFFCRKNTKFQHGDFYKTEFKNADIIYCYLFQETNNKLEKKLKRLKKGTLIISNTFKFNELKLVKKMKKNLFIYKI